MSTSKETRFGALPPKYNFVFNPYPGERLTRCPFCREKTGQRKVPLVIHVDPRNLIALNYTCRYCSNCDLLIAHKHEVEHLLTELFQQLDPTAIGNRYLVMGMLDKKAWRESVKEPVSFEETRARAHDFKTRYQELRRREQGWFPEGKVPPIKEPPPSQEWVKSRRK